MNSYPPQAGFAPFIPAEGLPIQYGYGGGAPRPDGHLPLLVPVYPFGLASHPFGYPNPNYPVYPPPTDNHAFSPISTHPSSHQPNPPFLPPQPSHPSSRQSNPPFLPQPSHPSSHQSNPPFLPPQSSHPGSAHPYLPSHAPSNRSRSHRSPPSSTTSTTTTTTTTSSGAPIQPPHPPSTRITGRFGIHELLNCQLDSHPYIDWIIYNDLSLARQWVIGNSGTERCQSVAFDGLAVLPPVNNLSIRTKGRARRTPVGQAIQRWGDIRVCRFDRFLSVGDVLHEIWAYFHAPLTETEQSTMQPSFARRVEVCFQKRWNAQGILAEQAVKRRCDTLLDCVRFAGLEIGIDFESCRELYLSLEDANLR